jgi:hypothetical protein
LSVRLLTHSCNQATGAPLGIAVLPVQLIAESPLPVAEYNTLRTVFIFVMALFFGTAFWQMGLRR